MSEILMQLSMCFSPDAHRALCNLQELAGHDSLQETVATALRSYGLEFTNGICHVAEGGSLHDDLESLAAKLWEQDYLPMLWLFDGEWLCELRKHNRPPEKIVRGPTALAALTAAADKLQSLREQVKGEA